MPGKNRNLQKAEKSNEQRNGQWFSLVACCYWENGRSENTWSYHHTIHRVNLFVFRFSKSHFSTFKLGSCLSRCLAPLKKHPDKADLFTESGLVGLAPICSLRLIQKPEKESFDRVVKRCYLYSDSFNHIYTRHLLHQPSRSSLTRIFTTSEDVAIIIGSPVCLWWLDFA
jgi:hypothetical protein